VTNDLKLAERGLALMRAGLTRRQLLRVLGLSSMSIAAAGLLAACEDDDAGDDAGEDTAAADSDDAGDDHDDEAEVETDDHDDEAVEDADDIEEEEDVEHDDGLAAEGDSLVVGVQGLPDTVDPYLELSNVGTRVTYSMFDHLIERDFMSGDTPGAGFGLNPMLAESWERIDDLTLEFQLREDVTFHNGDPMTAEDVKFTFDRMIVDTPDDLIEAAAYIGTVTEVIVIDEYTVQFVTAEPDPILENRLCSWCTWILPKDYFEDVGADEFAQNPVGTGPYQFVSMNPDEHLRLVRFDDYFMGPAAAAELEFRVIPETAGRVAAIASGEVDIITNVAPDQVEPLEETDQVYVSSIPLANCHVLVYNTFHPSMDDKRIRQAMNYAIDRELLVDALWGGRAVLMRGHQFEEYGDMFNPDRPYTPYDPDRARELLEEAGYDGEEIIYFCNSDYYTNEVVAGEAIVQMWQEVGINASQQVVESMSDVSFQEMNSRTWSNSSFTADPDGAFWLRWGPETWPRLGPANWEDDESYWDATEEFDELGESMRRTLDQEERFEMFQQILDIWEDEAPGTVLYIPMENYAIREHVEWNPYSFFYMDFRPHNFQFR
jgi:peptide/nickel transport system substrate-binding protein